MAPSDETLAIRARAGDKPAFAELAARYQQRLLRFLLTRSRSRADAEDTLQDTFMNAWRYLDSFDDSRNFSSWIFRIAINAASSLKPGDVQESADIPDPDADPLLSCLRDSERQNLWLGARQNLSDDAFNALWLRYAEGLSIQEISTALDRKLTWVKVTLMRSRNRLAELMAESKRDELQGRSYG